MVSSIRLRFDYELLFAELIDVVTVVFAREADPFRYAEDLA